MPRYFFHLVSDQQVSLDNQGVQLKELSSAHEYGLKLQRQLREHSVEKSSSWIIKVADHSGETALIILPQLESIHAFSYPCDG
jgi:hypothetical protein